MPINEVEIVSFCAECGTEFETVTVKKDNMMLTTNEQVWGSKCQENRSQVRDMVGRLKAIEEEQQSYPKAVPAEPFPGQAAGR